VDTAKQDRAERLFRQQEEAPKALAEYRAKQEATRLLTAKLRVERLAREALKGKPKPDRKRVANRTSAQWPLRPYSTSKNPTTTPTINSIFLYPAPSKQRAGGAVIARP
jgi:hypothetical protein